MSLVVALTSKGGSLLAADSRGTIGDPRGLTAIRDTHEKLIIAGNNTVIGFVGAYEFASKILDELKTDLKNDGSDTCDEVMNKLHINQCRILLTNVVV